MKKTIYGCTLLIMGTMFATNSALELSIPLWVVGFLFIAWGSKPDHDYK